MANALVIDSDRNGLPDDWEIKHFGYLGVDRNDDPDGDETSNLREHLAGTDPKDFFNGVRPLVEALNGGGPDEHDALVMTVKKPDGTPWPNAPASFTISSGGRRISPHPGGPDYSFNVEVKTDVNGIAKVYLEPL